jgi:hypothetical protein
MEHTILMSIKHLTTVALAVSAGLASATCYVRSNTLSTTQASIEQRVDEQNTVVPLASGQFRCTATFRALIRNNWYHAEGQAIHSNQVQACTQALSSGSVQILTEVSGTTLTTQEEMVCTDQPLPQIRAVSVGDIIRVSEVLPDPQWPQALRFRDRNTYRRFIEPTEHGKILHGVLRRLSETAWLVVDKW